MSDIYKTAALTRIRFASTKGDLTVEQLFQLPLTSKTGFDLDTVAKTINTQLKSVGEESFVEDVSESPQKRLLTVGLDIVKDVIKTKQEENRAAMAKTQRAVERKKLLDLISSKKDEKLSQASIEELEKKLNELDA